MARILVADDESSLLELVRFSLIAEGFEVEAVPDGKKALEKARQNRYDLIILDVMMPYVDGYHVSSEIAQDPASPPIVLMTSREFDHDTAAIQGSGASAFVSKPFEIPELLSVVKRMINDHQS